MQVASQVNELDKKESIGSSDCRSGPYFMVDAVADVAAFIEHATRYSRPMMGR